jgi:hypothetical protein
MVNDMIRYNSIPHPVCFIALQLTMGNWVKTLISFIYFICYTYIHTCMHKYIHTLAGLYGNFIGFYPSPCRIITWMCWRSSITTITGCSLIVSLITNQQTPVWGTFSDYRKLIIYIYILFLVLSRTCWHQIWKWFPLKYNQDIDNACVHPVTPINENPRFLQTKLGYFIGFSTGSSPQHYKA